MAVFKGSHSVRVYLEKMDCLNVMAHVENCFGFQRGFFIAFAFQDLEGSHRRRRPYLFLDPPPPNSIILHCLTTLTSENDNC